MNFLLLVPLLPLFLLYVFLGVPPVQPFQGCSPSLTELFNSLPPSRVPLVRVVTRPDGSVRVPFSQPTPLRSVLKSIPVVVAQLTPSTIIPTTASSRDAAGAGEGLKGQQQREEPIASPGPPLKQPGVAAVVSQSVTQSTVAEESLPEPGSSFIPEAGKRKKSIKFFFLFYSWFLN